LLDATTELSVVGIDPGKAAPFASIPGVLGPAAAGLVEATTEESSVGINEGGVAAFDAAAAATAVAAGAGEFSGSDGEEVMFAFSNAVCWSFTCCCKVLTVSVRERTCSRRISTSLATLAEEGGADDAGGAGLCARTSASGPMAKMIKMILFTNVPEKSRAVVLPFDWRNLRSRA
jgi:hypothetical protein